MARRLRSKRMRPQTDGATWPIAVLTSAFCPEFDPQRLAMAMCVGYFNGRDSRDSAGLFTVSGFVSSKVRWREFETRWSRQLRQEGLATFNATEWMNGTGEFASGWSDVPRRRGLMAALTRMTEQHVLHAFTQTISLSDYDAIDAEYEFGRAVGGPYNVCAALLMTTVRRWMAAKHPDDLTLFIFEQGDIEQRGLQRMLEGVRAETGEPAQIWPRRWRDERGRRRHLRPLEACQLFAADQDGSFQKRLTERSLLEAGIVDREQLARVCRALGIAHRSVIDADEGRGVALGSQ
jgi:hypothetical protein